MKLELSLLELNDLYYATSKLVEQRKDELNRYGANISSINYFKKELDKAEDLCNKVQTAMYDTVAQIDEAIEYLREAREKHFANV